MPSTITDRLKGLTTSVAVKAPCRLKTTANHALSGLSAIDGVTPAADDRILVGAQTDTTENGIYVANTSAWTRAADFDGSLDIVGGTQISVIAGTENATTYWKVAGSSTIAIGTDAVTFEPGGLSLASAITYTGSGTGAVARTVQSKLREATVSVDDYGAAGNGTADDRPAILAAQVALLLQGGGELLFTRGKEYRVSAAIPIQSGITYRGTGKGDINLVANAPGAKIRSMTGAAIFTNQTTTVNGIRFLDLFLQSPFDGGHIFDFSLAGVTAKIEFSGITAIQENPAKSVIYGNAGGGVFSLWWHDGEWQYADGATVSPISLVSPTINSVVFERFWSTASNELSASGAYAIYIESSNPSGPAINVIIRDGVFEFSKHGAVKFLSCVQSGIENCTSYDLSAVPTAVMFSIGDGGSAPPSNNCWMKGLRARNGTVAVPDAKIDCSISGQSGFLIDACSFAYLDGGNATPGILIHGGDITNLQNIAYTRLGATAGLDLHFGTSDAASKSYTIWNGYAGNAQGYLNIHQAGAYKGAVNPSGDFQWGGTLVTPNVTLKQTGDIYANGDFYRSNLKVVGARGAALPADATDLATVITLANAIKARLKATGGHGLVAD